MPVGRVRRTIRTDPSPISAEGNTENTNREIDRLLTLLERRNVTVDWYDKRPLVSEKDEGAKFISEDGGTWVHDGDLWRPLRDGVIGWQPPEEAIWKAGGAIRAPASFLDAKGTIKLTGNLNAGTAYREGYHIALTADTTTGVVEAGFQAENASLTVTSQDVGFGILLYESATGKVFGNEYLVTQTSTTTLSKLRRGYSGTLAGPGWSTAETAVFDKVAPSIYLRISFNGGNLRSWSSTNRQAWYSNGGDVAVATAFTTAPDRVGIYVIAGSHSYASVATCHHFKQGAITEFPYPF